MKKVITTIVMIVIIGLIKSISQIPTVNEENNEFLRNLINTEIQNISNLEIERIISNLELTNFSLEELNLNTQYTSLHENLNLISVTVNSMNNTQEKSLGLTFIFDKASYEIKNRMASITIRGRTLVYEPFYRYKSRKFR